ncbi:Uncharacterised protein [Bordetella pseudohinzii]|uniref:Uncharacterized protein n=1 Tax=Bordetella pseudohinzii TaxID=1331258 RepID=A0A0M7BRZ0_9BORD|nr:Uncharacterised protein [Bordetella pseudohinzii]
MRGHGDLAHQRRDPVDGLQDFLHGRACGAGLCGAGRHSGDGLVDQGLDFLGGLSGALRQAADLAGHDREALALLAGPGRFDRGVQGEDIGLEGDAFDHGHDLGDFLGAVIDGLHGRDQVADEVAAPRRRGLAVLGQRAGGRGVFGVAGHGRGQLLDAGCGVLQRVALFFRALGQGLAAFAQLGDGLDMVRGLGDDFGRDPRQAFAHDVEVEVEVARLSLDVGVDFIDQVAGGDLARDFFGLGELARKAGCPPREGDDDGRAAQAVGCPPGLRVGDGRIAQGKVGGNRRQRADGDGGTDGRGNEAAAQGVAGAGQRPAPAGRHALAALERIASQAVGRDVLVKLLGLPDLLRRGLDPHRGVAGHFAVLDDRHGIGQHPIEPAGLVAILDDGQPGPPGLQRMPHVFEHRRRHVGVAHDVVRLAQQFVAREAADFHKGRVAVGDAAFEVRLGNEVLIVV